MTFEEKLEISKLYNPTNLEEHVEVSNVLHSILLKLIKSHHNEPVETEEENDAKFTIQLLLSKIKYLIVLSNGIELYDGPREKFKDPSVNLIISRNIFETVIHFNSIFFLHDNDDMRKLIYTLWKLSSLKHRSKLFNCKPDEEKSQQINELQQDEKNQIDELIRYIRSLNVYSQGTDQTKSQIDLAIKKKKIWIDIINGDVNASGGPQKLCNKMTKDQILLKEQYTRFSLLTHPSKETVNMVQNIRNLKAYEELVEANFRVTNALISMFISDYVNLFPQIKETFEALPLRHQMVTTFYNNTIRVESTGINETFKLIDQ